MFTVLRVGENNDNNNTIIYIIRTRVGSSSQPFAMYFLTKYLSFVVGLFLIVLFFL